MTRASRGVSFATVRRLALALLRPTFTDRDALVGIDPESFFITDHYRDHPSVLVRRSTVRSAVLREVLEQAWRHCAPKALVARHDAG